MPRKPLLGRTPGPKSKTKTSKISSFLGDSTAEETSDAESFRSPELEAEHTDYGFDYTTRNSSSRRSTTKPSAAASTTNNSQIETRRSTAQTSTQAHTSTQAQTSARPRQVSPNKKKPRKQSNPPKRKPNIWAEVRELQKRTDNLTPKAPFGRLIRELLIEQSSTATRITVTALEALQTSSEIYLSNLFADAYVCTLHRGRVTLGVHDVRLVRFLRGTSDAGNKH